MLALLLALSIALITVAPARANTTVDALLRTTPQIYLTHDPLRAPGDVSVVAVRGTDVEGVPDMDGVVTAPMANGQLVIALPLLEAYGRDGTYDVLLWTLIDGHWRFVGYVPSSSGWIIVSYDRPSKSLEFSTEMFDHYHYDQTKDYWLVEHYTVDGIKLVLLSKKRNYPGP